VIGCWRTKVMRGIWEGGQKESSWRSFSNFWFESNLITPGAEFMAVLSIALQYYIHNTVTYVHIWMLLFLMWIFLEHKIMSYIRLQINLEGYDPNTRTYLHILLFLESCFFFTFTQCLLCISYHGFDQLVHIILVFYYRMLVRLCLVWLLMKFIFQSKEKSVH
jgi:hypothetical protein